MQEDRLWNKNGGSAKITYKDWMKLDLLGLLLLIPIAGPIMLIGIYIFLYVHKDTAESIRSRIKASLIWMLIYVIIAIIIIAVVFVIAMANFAGSVNI